VPFVRFRVERTLALGDAKSPEGRDRVLQALKPALRDVPPGAMRDELIRVISSKLDIHADAAARLLQHRRDAPPTPDPDETAFLRVDRAVQAERSFLGACLAVPHRGRRLLASTKPEHFTDRVAWRAAQWLDEHFDDPLAGVPDDDAELRGVLQELVARGNMGAVEEAVLELERIQLEYALLERRIASAGPGEQAELARSKIALRAELDAAMERSMA
jgi:hypothetical protein